MTTESMTATDEATEDDSEQATVLVVDDEEAVAEAYKLWLADEHDVRTAHDGAEALEKLDDSVDVVLLDRQMPTLTGDEALETIRERGYDCRVAMVTGVDPDFDILEMPFDAYLTKPVDDEAVRDVVDRLLSLSAYDEQSREYFRLAEKKGTLEAEKASEKLAGNDEYADLQVRLDELERELDDLLTSGDEEALGSAFRSFPGDDPSTE